MNGQLVHGVCVHQGHPLRKKGQKVTKHNFPMQAIETKPATKASTGREKIVKTHCIFDDSRKENKAGNKIYQTQQTQQQQLARAPTPGGSIAVAAAAAPITTNGNSTAPPPPRQRRSNQTNNAERGSVHAVTTFADAFPPFPINERMQSLDQETTRQAQKEMVEAQRQARQSRGIEGDAVAGDGTLFFTNHSIGTQAPIVGDNSRVSRN
jgi:hypothetical protein